MSVRRGHAGKVDAVHAEVRQALRQHGYFWGDLASLGAGWPDALVAWPGCTGAVLVEVKDGAKSPSARRLTPDQVTWHQSYPGPLVIVLGAEDAVQKLAQYRAGL